MNSCVCGLNFPQEPQERQQVFLSFDPNVSPKEKEGRGLKAITGQTSITLKRVRYHM